MEKLGELLAVIVALLLVLLIVAFYILAYVGIPVAAIFLMVQGGLRLLGR